MTYPVEHFESEERYTEHVYRMPDGVLVQVRAERGKPKAVRNINGKEATMIGVFKYSPSETKKGREKVPTEIEDNSSNPGIYYVYGNKEYPREEVVQAGPPPAKFKGERLVKIIKRTPTPGTTLPPEIIPLWKKGWKEGMKVSYIGSDKVATVVSVREEVLIVSFPNDPFLIPVKPSRVDIIED